MPMQLDDTALRAQLSEDLKTAWGVTEVRHGPPQTALSGDSLPVVFIELGDIVPQRGGITGVGRVRLPHIYTITLRDRFPAPPATIEETKVGKAQAALDVLTANATYLNDWRQEVGAVRFVPQQLDNQEWVYDLSIEFIVQVLSRSYGGG